MESLIVLIVVLILGYISTHFIFNKIQSKYYVPSGIEYIFLGILISPAFSRWFKDFFGYNYPTLISPEMITQLIPGIAAAIGFIGFIYGLNFNFKNISSSEPEHWRLALFEIFFSFLIIGGISFFALNYLWGNENNLNDIIAAAFALSVIGAFSSNFIVSSLITRNKVSGRVGESLVKSSLINSNLNIFLYGLLFSIIHIGANSSYDISAIEWIVISIVLAFLIGFLFFIFIGRETDEKKLFVAILGIVIFTSGIAYFLNFSPLYMNFILGMMLANFSKIASKIKESLERLFQPMSILVVVMAGFIWVPPSLVIFIAVSLTFILLRFITKSTAGSVAYHSAYSREKLSPGIGKGLMSLDIVTCAMIIDYVNVYNNEFTPIVVSAVLTSIILFNVIGYSMAKNLLVDVGEITGESK
ncbi:MAG: hypothetical protein KKF62_03665 [Bacteroidetes bacterium]|nr:hypothetical protein [Bacteroidota bacterium]MBU1115566.1 hypothetical protein [Bacteroidota bacterium]MBU1798610.1 hypothetical protein [Bacteroidota bacterium]